MYLSADDLTLFSGMGALALVMLACLVGAYFMHD